MKTAIVKCFAVCTAVVLMAWPSVEVAAQDYEAPYIESGLGATNIEATVGNQRLTVGVTKDGGLSVLSWPSPSYYDHLHYMTTNALDARLRPRFGADERMGAFAGIAVQRQGTDEVEASFLRDDPWENTVTYADIDVGTVHTIYEHAELGLTIHQYDVVPPDRDALVRNYEIERAADSDVEDAWLIGYSNLSPNLSKVPQVPLADVMLDHRADFLAMWDETAETLIHFQPGDTGIIEQVTDALMDIERDFGPVGELLVEEQIDEQAVFDIAAELDDHYAPGVYAAISSVPAPDQFQVGEDRTDTCAILDEIADNIAALEDEFPDVEPPADPDVVELARCGGFDPLADPREEQNWHYQATDAFDDASDGELQNNPVAGANVNTALRVPLEFEDDRADAALVFTFDLTREATVDLLDDIRGDDLAELREETEAKDRQFVDDLWIPDEITGDLREFVKRTFLNIRVGTDGDSGAVMASISRQPAYQLDWPRDGAFFNVALDIAGQHDLVTRRMEFYNETIRDEPKEPDLLLNEPVPGWPDDPNEQRFPADSWEMNYYADGMVGGPIRLEIDNTALLVWAYVYHVGHLEGDERQEYIEQIAWPTVERANDWLAGWRDPETGLNWPANEDDHIEYTQGLQGAATTFSALVEGAKLARYVGEDDKADAWLDRAGELRDAAMEEMYFEDEGFYNFPGRQVGTIGEGPPTWLGWPTHMLEWEDPRLIDQIEEDLEFQLRRVAGEEGTAGYPTKAAIPAALIHGDESMREKALEIAEAYVEELSNPDTWTTGEAFMPVDDTGDGQTDRFMYGVSTPHLWTSALVYLTLVAYYHPEVFDPHHDVLPEVEVPGEYTPEYGEDDEDDGEEDDEDEDDGDEVDDGETDEPADEEPAGCQCGATGGGGGLLAVVVLVAIGVVRRE